jgi:hypothetical protein
MKKVTLYFFVAALTFSCNENEKTFPVEPHIKFESLSFAPSQLAVAVDTLKLKFYFTDGDSDLGLPSSALEPYNYRNYYFRSSGLRFTSSEDSFSDNFKRTLFSKLPELITYKDKRSKALDTLPKFISPYSCTNWEIVRNQSGSVTDTVYFQSNLNFYNLFVDCYVYSNGDWVQFDPKTLSAFPYCSEGFYARIPLFKDITPSNSDMYPFSLHLFSDKEGTITYLIMSFGIRSLFGGKKIKLKVRIQDRALHKSNEIETSEIQF